MKTSVRQMLEEANKQILTIDTTAAINLVGDADTVFVDLRDPREVEREGKIPNAFHCTRGMLEFWIDPESPYHKSIFAEPKRFVFYCASGWRSALATKTAQDMGLANAAHIEGGYSAWQTAGGPTEISTSKK